MKFRTILPLIAAIGSPDVAKAAEAAAGRYIPGAYATPGAGIVPPVPGLYWGWSNAYYHGDASGAVPYGDGTVAVGLEADTVASILAGIYVPNWDLPGNWTYAFQAALPFGYTYAKATVGLADVVDETAGLGDIAITPLLFGWHNDAKDLWISTGLTITAPTGRWQEGQLAFVGLNYWTFTPTIGITRLIPEHGLDLSAKLGVDINTRNPDTDNYSGATAHLDLAMTKSVTENWQVGAIAGFLYQFEDDDSAFANARDDGFKGRSVAIGPLVKYKAKVGTTEIDLSLSWAHELAVENRMKGDAFFFTVSGKF
ncbi:SphA family protein [Neorhizobium sp. DT-125]|uniref:SphA family protein n=1 Tax=Neorhizobium sp. DT-125 TaxID=3396163 RepID=UPI003F1E1662